MNYDKNALGNGHEKVRLLLIEDSEPCAKLVRREIERSPDCPPVEIDEAYSLKEGLAALDAKKYDGAIVDPGMPGGGRLSNIMTVLSHPSQVAVIVLTGYGTIVEAMRAVRGSDTGTGIAGYWLKDDIKNPRFVWSIMIAIAKHQDLNALVNRLRTLESAWKELGKEVVASK